jgi:hypothetical protein
MQRSKNEFQLKCIIILQDSYLFVSFPSFLKNIIVRAIFYYIETQIAQIFKILFKFIFQTFALSLNKYDHHVIAEADSLKLPSIGIFDSNSNPFLHASYSAPGNDESIMTQTFYLRLIFRALRFGHQLFILKWLKRRGRFVDQFFKLFYNRIYRVRIHQYKLSKLKDAYYFTNYLNNYDNNDIINNINYNNKSQLELLKKSSIKTFFSEKPSNDSMRLMNNTDLAITNFVINYFARRKLFQFLYKQLRSNNFSPLFHFNLMDMTTVNIEILYPTNYIRNTALYPYTSLLNAFPASFKDYDHDATNNEWYGKAHFNTILRNEYSDFTIDNTSKMKFIHSYCRTNFFLYNARMDRFGWRKKARTTKKIVYRFLNFLEFKKQFRMDKIAEYRALVVNKHILKPAEYMYRKHRINFLNVEEELDNGDVLL